MTTVNTIDALWVSTGEYSEKLGCILEPFARKLRKFIEDNGDQCVLHGSFGCDSTVQCLVPGSDVDAVILSSRSFDETRQSIMSFCAESGWGNKTFDRNLVTLFPGSSKIDLLLVKDTAVTKYMPCAFSSMGGEYEVYESLRGPIRGDIDVSEYACNRVYNMTQTIKESQIGAVAYLFMKIIIKAYGINVPSVAVICAMVGSINVLNSRTNQGGHDSKYLFSTALKNCMDILMSIGVGTRSMAEPYCGILNGCCDVHRGPYFDIITPFQGMVVNENVKSLGDVLCNLQILTAGLMGLFTDAKSQNGTHNLALLACALRHADAETLDPTMIKEMFSNPSQSGLLNKSTKDKVKIIQGKLTEKDALVATHKTLAANMVREEVNKASNAILKENFGDIHIPVVAVREVGGTMFFSETKDTILDEDN
jgi:hypothetical protein